MIDPTARKATTQDHQKGLNPRLEAALGFLESGYPVVICDGKNPGGVMGNDWQKKKLRPEDVEGYFEDDPGRNVGIRLGPDGGLVDIEADSKEEENLVVELFAGCGFPFTPTFKSRRGCHYLFKFDPRLHATKSAVINYRGNGKGKLGVRIGSDGKGVHSCVPPSINEDDTERQWYDGQSLDDIEPAKLPDKVVERLLAAASPSSNGEPKQDSAAGSGVVHLKALRSMLQMPVAQTEANGSFRLFTCACRAVEYDLPDASAIATIREYARSKPFPKSYSDKQILQRVRDAEKKAQRGKKVTATTDADPPGGDSKPRILRPRLRKVSEIERRNVSWMWQYRIAMGKLTLLVGDPGVGKSLLSLDIASRVTRGAAWPDNPESAPPRGGVVILSAEDDPEDTIAPRLDKANADGERINIMTGVYIEEQGEDEEHKDRFVDVSLHLSAIENAIEKTPACKLVVVDPISAFMGDKDGSNNVEVRRVLAPLSKLANDRGVAILAVTHMRKGEGSALYRASGSIAFTAAARAVWYVAEDKEDSELRLFLRGKNNLAKAVSGLSFRVADGPSIDWQRGEISETADAVLGIKGSKRGAAVQEAKEFLEAELAGGRRRMTEMETGADKQGISRRTLQRAKAELRIKSDFVFELGCWFWELP